ncbi:unnamed protein product, partial [Polarella glacialis]
SRRMGLCAEEAGRHCKLMRGEMARGVIAARQHHPLADRRGMPGRVLPTVAA